MQSYFKQFDADKAAFHLLVMSSSVRLEKGFANFIREATKLVSLNNTFDAGESRVNPSHSIGNGKPGSQSQGRRGTG